MILKLNVLLVIGMYVYAMAHIEYLLQNRDIVDGNITRDSKFLLDLQLHDPIQYRKIQKLATLRATRKFKKALSITTNANDVAVKEPRATKKTKKKNVQVLCVYFF